MWNTNPTCRVSLEIGIDGVCWARLCAQKLGVNFKPRLVRRNWDRILSQIVATLQVFAQRLPKTGSPGAWWRVFPTHTAVLVCCCINRLAIQISMAITHKIYNTSILELYIATSIYIWNIFFINHPRLQYNLVWNSFDTKLYCILVFQTPADLQFLDVCLLAPRAHEDIHILVDTSSKFSTSRRSSKFKLRDLQV
jgi:hypothetical protein